MKALLTALGAAALLAACTPIPATPGVAPDGTSVPTSSSVLSGRVQGAKVGAQTKVALIGAFKDRNGAYMDGLGKPASGADAHILSAIVKEGKYAFALPQTPVGAGEGAFEVYLYNDKNDNNVIDDGEDKTKGSDGKVAFYPIVGWQVLNANAGGLDALAKDKFDLLFN